MMTDKKSIDEKIKDIGAKFPGIKEKLEPSSTGSWGIHLSSYPEDIIYLETENYQIAVSKWEQHCWSEGGGGIEWTEWLNVNYKNKEEEEMKLISTDRIVTRDQYNQYKDKRELWPYDFAGIEQLSKNKFLVYWKDEEGSKGLSYELKLDK